jgi:putative alpha-1,2-mannosidase
VGDVAEIVRGTYFDAHFLTTDGKKWYRFFDEEDYSATLMIKDNNGKWNDEPEKSILSPTLQVRHLRSSEDIHTFEISDRDEDHS